VDLKRRYRNFRKENKKTKMEGWISRWIDGYKDDLINEYCIVLSCVVLYCI